MSKEKVGELHCLHFLGIVSIGLGINTLPNHTILHHATPCSAMLCNAITYYNALDISIDPGAGNSLLTTKNSG